MEKTTSDRVKDAISDRSCTILNREIMKKVIRICMLYVRFFLAFSFLSLAACVAPTSAIVDDIAARQETVGLYAIIPNNFNNIKIGTTVFQNVETQRSSARWNMNELSESLLKAQLQADGVSRVQVLGFRPRVFAQDTISASFTGNQAPVLKPVFAQARANGLTKLAVIQPHYYREGPTDVAAPYGLISRSAFGVTQQPQQYIRLEIKFYSTATEKPLQSIYLQVQENTTLPFKNNAGQYSGSELEQIETSLKQLLRTTISQEFAGN